MDKEIKKIIKKEKGALNQTLKLLKKDKKQDKKLEKLEKGGKK